jgi:TolA-binding protein
VRALGARDPPRGIPSLDTTYQEDDVPTDPTEDRISSLESRITALQAELSQTRKQLTDAQLDQWKGRIDELEVQMHLGRLDAQEQMAPIVEQLRNWWLDAREQIGVAGTTAGDAFSSLRMGVEQAMEQLRSGARSARGSGD